MRLFALNVILAISSFGILSGTLYAQKKPPTAAKVDKQTLSDAYDVMQNLVSEGATEEVWTSDYDRRNNDPGNTYVSVNRLVVAEPDKCAISWDEVSLDKSSGDAIASEDNRQVFLLNLIDLKRILVQPNKDVPPKTYKDKVITQGGGFLVGISYIRKEGDASIVEQHLSKISNPNNRKGVVLAGSVGLATSADADRFIKAISYAAKTCGAREVAF